MGKNKDASRRLARETRKILPALEKIAIQQAVCTSEQALTLALSPCGHAARSSETPRRRRCCSRSSPARGTFPPSLRPPCRAAPECKRQFRSMTEDLVSTHPQEAETDALDGRDAAVLTRSRVAPPGSAPVVLHSIPALSWNPLDRYILPGKKLLSNMCFGRKKAGGEAKRTPAWAALDMGIGASLAISSRTAKVSGVSVCMRTQCQHASCRERGSDVVYRSGSV